MDVGIRIFFETNTPIVPLINVGGWASGQHPVSMEIKPLQKYFRVNILSSMEDSCHLHWQTLWWTLVIALKKKLVPQGTESCLQRVLPILHIGMLKLFLNHQYWAWWLGKWINITCMFVALAKHDGRTWVSSQIKEKPLYSHEGKRVPMRVALLFSLMEGCQKLSPSGQQ